MKGVALALRQVRYENAAFWRNPVSALFTMAFPLMFLVIFNLLFGSSEIRVEGGVVSTSTFYVPAITALGVIGACYTNVAIGVCFSRDGGLLKRVRGTPLPGWALLFGKVGHAVLLALLLVAVIVAAGVLFYGVDVPSNALPAFVVTLAVGAAAFCALGLAITAVIPNADASPAVVNASILPLLFISDVFIPLHDAPGWLTTFAGVFPVSHFAAALHTAFNPFEAGLGFEPLDLAVLAAWGVVGLLLAARFFRWEQRG